MQLIELKLADNTTGKDPVDGLYKAINTSFASLGLTKANSKILSIQPAAYPGRPFMTRVLVQKGENISAQYAFFYDRFHIRDWVSKSMFTASDLTQVAKLKSADELIKYIATKTKQNFLPIDFWSDPAVIPLTGGSNPPNWLMEARADSVYWTGEIVVWLHSGP